MKLCLATSRKDVCQLLKPLPLPSITNGAQSLWRRSAPGLELIDFQRWNRRLNHSSAVPDHQRQAGDPQKSPQANNGAKDKLAQRDLFLDILNVSATRRDAKQYLSWFKDTTKPKPQTKTTINNNGVKFGNAAPRAIAESPTFQQQFRSQDQLLQLTDTVMHMALVHLRAPQTIDDESLNGIALTLAQLVRLDMQLVFTFDCNDHLVSKEAGATSTQQVYQQQAERIVKAIERHNNSGARYVDSALEVKTPEGSSEILSERTDVEVAIPRLFSELLRKSAIPVIPSMAFTSSLQMLPVDAAHIAFALTRYLSGNQHTDLEARQDQTAQPPNPVSLDRIILIDAAGGLPSSQRQDNSHVFVNLEQEYNGIVEDLSKIISLPDETRQQHIRNINLLRRCLSILPAAASALMVSPQEAAISSQPSASNSTVADTGTRPQKNPLIHNLLTNKPVISSSLPIGRMTSQEDITAYSGNLPESRTRSTLIKRGMPLTMIPNPKADPWLPPANGETTIDLRNHPNINFSKLLALIEDSFRRPLDVEHYLHRIQNRIAGIIIAGDYEGGAIMTWEAPPSSSSTGSEDVARLVPYLDKFAVLQRSQGSSGVADIVFQALVRSCFPDGVCWRSRKDNPVNKWYFERSAGSWQLPDSMWTMFWTTEGLSGDRKRWEDYVGVCRGVEPSWKDGKRPD